jgi:hypothetical protein
LCLRSLKLAIVLTCSVQSLAFAQITNDTAVGGPDALDAICATLDFDDLGVTDTEAQGLLNSMLDQDPAFVNSLNTCLDHGGSTDTCATSAQASAFSNLGISPPAQQDQSAATAFGGYTFTSGAGQTARSDQAKPSDKQNRAAVNRAVCRYWLEKDKNRPGGGDQDGDGIPDRLDRDSYNGHGVGQAYPHPIPGCRAEDGHYNCEYFALYFRDALVSTLGEDGARCWIVHHDGHATVSYCYNGTFVIVEPQGGAPYFVDMPNLVLNNMPDPGASCIIDGARVYDYRKCNWLNISEQDPPREVPMPPRPPLMP